MITALMVGLLAQSGEASSKAHLGPLWPEAERQAQVEYEAALHATASAEQLRAWHDLLGSEPHVAGTPGDARNIELQAEAFRTMGLDVTVHKFYALLAQPVEARLEIIEQSTSTGTENDAGRSFALAHNISLPLKEAGLSEDPHASHPDLTIGWNAYSGSGDVTGEVVYANYGTKDDFEKLQEHGIDVSGKIVIARYGGNFRGFKAKFAQDAGAAGLLIYSDPDDSGYRQGVPYPEGGWANEGYIQRGSIKTLPYPGDPLTPGRAATVDAKRLDPDKVELPRIPVQPIGYGAAREIMTRMKGQALPGKLVKGWQGGLPFAYRLTGGSDLNVRLMVKQDRFITESANVIVTLTGADFPDEKIIIGCHHDAWGFGASDPLAGTILVFEAARSFAEAAKQGFRPARTIVFATWGAEEYGIIGSTEYCEQFEEELMDSAVAYINLDMATMGPNFRSSASPTLKSIIESVAMDVDRAGSDAGERIYEEWKGKNDKPSFGNLGGGSDHIGFYCRLGIPSCHLGSGGSAGTGYHSNYDTLAWYRHVVGEDYQPALMLTRAVNVMASRLANAPLLPLDASRYATDFKTHLEHIQKRGVELGVSFDTESIVRAADEFKRAAEQTNEALAEATASNRLSDKHRRAINAIVRVLEQQWLDHNGLPERSWYRNLFAATDPDSGYAAWMLPALRFAVERGDQAALSQTLQMYHDAFERLTLSVREIESIVSSVPVR